MTLADEDTNSILTDNAKRAIQGYVAMQVTQLDNLGAFEQFFTLSCADMRWNENFTVIQVIQV